MKENRPEKLLGQLCLKVGKHLAMHFDDKNDKICLNLFQDRWLKILNWFMIRLQLLAYT